MIIKCRGQDAAVRGARTDELCRAIARRWIIDGISRVRRYGVLLIITCVPRQRRPKCRPGKQPNSLLGEARILAKFHIPAHCHFQGAHNRPVVALMLYARHSVRNLDIHYGKTSSGVCKYAVCTILLLHVLVNIIVKFVKFFLLFLKRCHCKVNKAYHYYYYYPRSYIAFFLVLSLTFSFFWFCAID